ncbi:mediator of RNA polymerase II transcription subunit 15-like isoform X2 [Pectinophora gossypiella]|uniref:mediator of RNA polymerase II transcription subunit 15-like isoform X2 n=1 Tax=Pectinophora gossypiella TaxID=13191 RepID=UPI00214EA2AB|nr:mediator of RNA polymerase II transcription subunit 15-like isoform X2 [Pectinophora gossypiella]
MDAEIEAGRFLNQTLGAWGDSWRSPLFRQDIIRKLEEAIKASNKQLDGSALEDHIYKITSTRDEYLRLVYNLESRFIKKDSDRTGNRRATGPDTCIVCIWCQNGAIGI